MAYTFIYELKPWMETSNFVIKIKDKKLDTVDFEQGIFVFQNLVKLNILPMEGLEEVHDAILELRSIIESGVRCEWDSITSNNCIPTCSSKKNVINGVNQNLDDPAVDLFHKVAKAMDVVTGSSCYLGSHEQSRYLWAIGLEANTTYSFYVQYEKYYLTDSLKGYAQVTNLRPTLVLSGGAVTNLDLFFKEARIKVYGKWWSSILQNQDTIYIYDGERTGMNRAPDDTHGAISRAVLRNTYSEVHIYPEILPSVLARIGGATAFLAAIALFLRMHNQQRLSTLHLHTIELEQLVKVIKVVEEKLIQVNEKKNSFDENSKNELNIPFEMVESDSEIESLPFIPGLLCQQTQSESFR